MKIKLFAFLSSLALASAAHAAGYISATSLIGGTAFTFEGFSDGQLLGSGAYSGVTFSQPNGGRPQVDNFPFLFGYNQSSGVGVLTGSLEGGAPFPTVAGLIATFSTPASQVEAFLSDWSPLGNYTAQIFGSGGTVLETLNIPAASFPTSIGPGFGIYVGFTRPTADIVSVQFGPGVVFGDSFAIDDLRVVNAAPVNTPDAGSTAALFALGVMGLAAFRRKLRS